MYIVRLGPWNCSCAAFAFSAFPGAASSLVFDAEEHEADEDGDLGDGEPGGEKWQFGGVSRDGLGGGVPCCKHILACVLAERMAEWVGEVKVRAVSYTHLTLPTICSV